MSCDSEGKRASSSSDLWKIAAWNVRSLYQIGQLANVCKEMNRLKSDVLGISGTFWKGSGESMYKLTSGERFKVVYSGGEKRRKGAAFIIGKRIINLVLSYQTISERCMTLKVSGRTRNVLLHQVYAPNMDDGDEEVEELYRSIEIEGKKQKKWKDKKIGIADLMQKWEANDIKLQ